MLYIFDLEDTLIESYMKAKGRNYGHMADEEGRKAALAYLLLSGHKIAIVTNQGGVGYGLLKEDEAYKRVETAKQVLGLPENTKSYICMHHPLAKDPKWSDAEGLERRMPKPRMLYEAMVEHGETPDTTFFVCNFSGHRKSAEGTGIEHLTWNQFSQAHLPVAAAK